MDTYFAPAPKKDGNQLAVEIEFVNQSPIVSSLLSSISGLLAVLNEERQVIAVNDSFLKMIGIDDAQAVLGLRPGEAVKCIHANEMPNGCGTTQYCATCGAAVAIVTCLDQNLPVERLCALSAFRDNDKVDMSLLVRAHPIKINDSLFLLLYIQDITLQEKRAALERTFFHDINNIISILASATELLAEENPSDLVHTIYKTTLRLKKEISIQQCLLKTGSYTYKPLWHEISTDIIFEDLKMFATSHPSARKIKTHFQKTDSPLMIKTDISLLLRILYNMITNAMEATDEDGEIKIWMEHDDQSVCFCVWNRQVIPENVTWRIFQRNFSTKQEDGRGVGTYSMKLFGEQILGGRVWFTTSKEDGTVFCFSIPR